MLSFALRRGLATIATLLVASFLVYGAVYLAPGNPLGFILGGHAASARTIAAVKAEYHLNNSFFVAYGDWLLAIFHGNLGTSVISREPVGRLVALRLPTTLFLVIYASLLIAVAGIGIGVLSAVYRRVGRPLMAVATVGMAIPSFVVAVLLILIFAVDLAWFPALGSGSGFLGQLYHLTLPAIALAVSLVAYVARVTNAAVTAELQREHVETARARGFAERFVVRRHVLRNAWIPISTVAGLSVGALIAGDVIVEQAFGLNGIGALLLQAVIQKDFPVVQAVALLLVLAFVLINTAVDVGYVLADPRVRKVA